MINKIRGALLGLIVGDALGVPAEIKTRETLDEKPIEGMTGFGSHNLPPGTWSDDSSMTLCLAEALIPGYDLNRIADNFLAWLYEAKWTPYGKTFGVGSMTSMAGQMLKRGFSPEKSGSSEEAGNGNGSLMRTIPLLWHIIDKDVDTRYKITKEVSSITHAHARSVVSCFIYLEFARCLYEGMPIDQAFSAALEASLRKVGEEGFVVKDIRCFSRLLKEDFKTLPREEIESSGYVIHTLEASIWCFMTTDSYRDAVLKAVNLGGDSDTTAAVTGALAGIVYGVEGIPGEWLNTIVRLDDINRLIGQFCDKYERRESTHLGN